MAETPDGLVEQSWVGYQDSKIIDQVVGECLPPWSRGLHPFTPDEGEDISTYSAVYDEGGEPLVYKSSDFGEFYDETAEYKRYRVTLTIEELPEEADDHAHDRDATAGATAGD